MVARIVLVDDDRDFTSLVSEILRQQGWDVVACNVEADAVRCIRDAHPDLSILDIRMSTRESGWRIVEELQRDPATSSLPIIVCSAAMDDIQRRALWMEERGIATLSKPFDIDDLIQLVQEMLPDDPADGASRQIGTNGDKWTSVPRLPAKG